METLGTVLVWGGIIALCIMFPPLIFILAIFIGLWLVGASQ